MPTLEGPGAIRWLLLASMLYACSLRSEPVSSDQSPVAPPLVVVVRDEQTLADPYLDAASAYYTQISRTERVPAQAHSLTDLHNLLVEYARAHGTLGDVVLVVHGSTWTGAAIDLFPGGPKASVSSMRRAQVEQSFPPLPEDVVDAKTRFILDSCAVGRHRLWVNAFAQLWVGSESAPEVVASSGFVSFTVDHSDQYGRRWRRSVEPVRVTVVPGPSKVAAETRERLAPQQCADVPSPCEQRLLPIRVEVDLDASNSARPLSTRRRLVQKLARSQLRDLNLRPDQLLWRVAESVQPGTQRWQGLATAIVVSPATGNPTQ